MIIHTIRNLDRSTGGVPIAVVELLRALSEHRSEAQWQLIAQTSQSPVLPQPTIRRGCVWQPIPIDPLGHAFHHALQESLKGNALRLIHDHGIWLPNNHWVANFARRWQVPRVVSLHGMLEPWAWQYKSFKKSLVWHLFQRRDLFSANALHATSYAEAQRIAEIVPHLPIAVIPWGVEVPSPAKKPVPSKNGTLRQALFLSRLHPVKGVLTLLEAWHQLQPQDWELVIAGPDEKGHRVEIERCLTDLNLQQVQLVGPKTDVEKWRAYQQADLFVLPSYNENFGLVIAESLAAGTPVITTKATPWQDLRIHRCGWWIETGVEPLKQALEVALAMQSAALQEMGERGRNLIKTKYTWSRVAEQIFCLYEWILGVGSEPGFLL